MPNGEAQRLGRDHQWDHLHNFGGSFPHPFSHCCGCGARRVCICGFSELNRVAHQIPAQLPQEQ